MRSKIFDLSDKTVIITGGAGLIGSAFSKACAEFNANVIVVDINESGGEKLIKDIKRETRNINIIFQKADITDIKEIRYLTDLAIEKFGSIDALVNNAYPRNANYGRKFEDVKYPDFCENIDTHLGGYFLISQEIAKIMIKQGGGNIINMGSIYGSSAPRFDVYEGTDMTMPVEYAAIKGGIINMTKYLASYLGKFRIRVNAISPGGVFADQPKSFVKKYSSKVVLENRMADQDDLIGVLIFLLSDASRYITGQNIIVDGGWSL